MWSGAPPEHQLAGLPAPNSTLLTTSHKSMIRNLRSQVHPHAPIQPALSIGPAQIGDQIVCGYEVRSESRLDRSFGQRDAQVRLAHAGQSCDILHLLAT